MPDQQPLATAKIRARQLIKQAIRERCWFAALYMALHYRQLVQGLAQPAGEKGSGRPDNPFLYMMR